MCDTRGMCDTRAALAFHRLLGGALDCGEKRHRHRPAAAGDRVGVTGRGHRLVDQDDERGRIAVAAHSRGRVWPRCGVGYRGAWPRWPPAGAPPSAGSAAILPSPAGSPQPARRRPGRHRPRSPEHRSRPRRRACTAPASPTTSRRYPRNIPPIPPIPAPPPPRPPRRPSTRPHRRRHGRGEPRPAGGGAGWRGRAGEGGVTLHRRSRGGRQTARLLRRRRDRASGPAAGDPRPGAQRRPRPRAGQLQPRVRFRDGQHRADDPGDRGRVHLARRPR
jgi:hypothetical protein